MYTCPTFKAEEKFLIKDIVSATFRKRENHAFQTTRLLQEIGLLVFFKNNRVDIMSL
jgi:hypothetical protein